MNRMLINPFFMYSLSFSISLILYELRWSSLYPELSENLFLFLLSTIIISLVFSVLLNSFVKIKCYNTLITKRNNTYILIFITIGFLSEFIYSRGVPLFSVLLGYEMNYKEFGIPSFHVFLLPYTSIFSIVSFYRFLENNKKKYFLISVIYSIFLISLVMNRGALLIILFSIGLILIHKKLSLKVSIFMLLSGVVTIYMFGFLGNKRMLSSGYQDELAILNIAEATDEFKDNIVPNEFFWGYLYSTISIANLENQDSSYEIDENKIVNIFLLESLPDFLSKRIYSEDELDKFKPILIKNELTTSTLYGRASYINGILGMVEVYIIYISFCLFCILLSPKNYKIVILSVLCVISSLSIFANMLVFSGTSLQIILAILFLSISSKRISLL